MNATDLVSAALVKVQGELEGVPFDSTNPFFKSRYASLGSVIGTSRPILAKHGLAILQVPTITDDLVSLRTTLVHSSGQTLDGGTMEMVIGTEGKSQVQIAGSIISYFRRYAWSSVLGIYAEEDDDGNSGPAPKPATPKVSSTSEPTPAFRLRALNRLQAAPGQPNRHLVAHFFQVKRWITVDQSPEDWPLNHVPRTADELTALSEEIGRFEMQQRQPQETT